MMAGTALGRCIYAGNRISMWISSTHTPSTDHHRGAESLAQRGATQYRYDGDGVLVAATTSGSTISYTQDLASPLSQILQTTQNGSAIDYLYGLDRLTAWYGSDSIWYAADALGSVRLTLDDGGGVLDGTSYDPWGQVETGSAPTFGFTGELQDSPSGMVYLRARWYNPQQGRFGARDPFQGDPEQPYSQHPYQYGLSDPVRMVDRSGWCAKEAFGKYEDPCMKAYDQAMELLGWSSSNHTDLFLAFDTAEFAALDKWVAAGIKLHKSSAWDSDSVQAVVYALERIEQAVGRQKAQSILGLSGGRAPRGSLVFENHYQEATSKHDIGGGGYNTGSTHIILNFLDYGADTSFMDKNSPGGILEGKVQTLIHEMGHVVDAVARPYAPAITNPSSPYWSRQIGGPWLAAAGWSKLCTETELWEISPQGRAGGVSLYAVAGSEGVVNRDPLAHGQPYEDFAETFAWYIMNRTSTPFYRNITPWYNHHKYLFENPSNGGAPNKERIDTLEDLLNQF